MISRWKPLVYIHRIKNWERKEAKILSMVLETKNTSKISDSLLLRLFPWVPSAFERICLLEESQAHFLTASDHPKWQSSEQKYLEENKPMPIIVLQIWMITWSYKELSIQERKQSPQDMFRHIIYIFTCHQKAERLRALAVRHQQSDLV